MSAQGTPDCVARPAWVPKPDDLVYGHKRVLAIDGGGIRGIIVGVVLEYLEEAILEVLREQNPTANISRKDIFLADYFDIISGTSTGGLLALYLASRGATHDQPTGLVTSVDRRARELPEAGKALRPGGATAALEMYRKNAKTIFETSVPGWLPKWGWVETINNALFTSKYGAKGIDSVLKSVFGDSSNKGSNAGVLTLKSLVTSVAITTFSVKELSPLTFTFNRYAKDKKGSLGRPGFTFVGKDLTNQYSDEELHIFEADFRVWEVARATSAAPTFFPVATVGTADGSKPQVVDEPAIAKPVSSVTVDNQDGPAVIKAPELPLELVDGGVAANDPAFQAVLIQARMYGNKHRLETGSDEPNPHVTDFAILSIGTGNTKSPAAIKSGAQLWNVQQLVSKILMGSPSDLVHSYFKAMMYHLPNPNNFPVGQVPPCPYLRIQKTDTSQLDPLEVDKLQNDILGLSDGQQPSAKQLEVYKNCLSVMDVVTDENMDMLERIGEFLGRYYSGKPLGTKTVPAPGSTNVLKEYVRAYLLKRK